MSASTEDNVKLICFKCKSSDTHRKVKQKLLRVVRRAERRGADVCAITHPLQEWTNQCHSIGALPADDILTTSSNSRYIVFLTKDGRVCRLKCTSRSDPSQQRHDNSVASILSTLRGSSSHHVSFQEESDAEYARQLQAEFEAESQRLLGGASVLGHSTFFMRAPSPSIPVREEVNRDGHEYMHLRIRSPTDLLYEHVSPRFSVRDGSTSPVPVPISILGRVGGASGTRTEGSPPPDYQSLFGERRFSGAPPVLGGTLGAALGGASGRSQTSSRAVMWPEMGSLEWLVCKQNPESSSQDNKFVAMAQLHSEILLVSAESRQLYSWSCTDQNSTPSSRSPSLVPHPLMEELGLSSERVSLIESSDVRATVVTESGKVATFYDALLRVSFEEDTPSLVQSLTHPAQAFPQLEGETIVTLSVSNFITTAITDSGKVFWWGLCPQNNDSHTTTATARNEDNQQSGGTRLPGRSRSKGTITDGSLVRLKNGPPCGPNSIVYSRSPCCPRVGKTMNIIEHSSLDPKTSVLVKVFKDDYRLDAVEGSSKNGKKKKLEPDLETGTSKRSSNLDNSSNYESLEVWKLSDVVFLNDSPAILGRVVTVDHPQAIVDISHSTNETGTLASSSNAKSTLKVFKVSELELCPIDYTDNGRHGQGQSSLGPSTSGESKSSLPVSVSQHVAGTVQHQPVCILAPDLARSQNSAQTISNLSTYVQGTGSGSSSTMPASVINGYTPLAVHTTDDGPTLLLERISDGSTFLIYSGHSSAGGLVGTSFVALNCKDSKVNRHTVEEESVPALEGGFKLDPVALKYALHDSASGVGVQTALGSEVDERSKVESGSSDSTRDMDSPVSVNSPVATATRQPLPLRRSARKRKLETSESSKSPSSRGQKVIGKSRTPEKDSKKLNETVGTGKTESPCQLRRLSGRVDGNLQLAPRINSDLLLLRDVNGKMCPLMDGLNLKPMTDAAVGVALPTMSYRCMLLRRYAVSKTQNVFVVVVVHRRQSLVPAVRAGDVIKVDSILDSLMGQVKGHGGLQPGVQPTPPVESESDQWRMSKPRTSDVGDDDDGESDIDLETPSPKRSKLSAALAPSSEESDNRRQSPVEKERGTRRSERLKTLTDVPPGMSFETEIPVLEKPTVAESSGAGSQSSLLSGVDAGGVSSPVVGELGEECFSTARVKAKSLGVLFETAVYNSNVLHVCCQLSDAASDGRTTIDKTDPPKVSVPSWLKPVAVGGSELSFEEERHRYMFSGRERGRKSLKEIQRMSISERKLEILDILLSTDEIRPIVMKLLSSRNAEGETPFMTSINSQNYAAALKITEFFEEWSRDQRRHQDNRHNNDGESKFFSDAILSPSRNGATPIQALLASLSPFYDIKSPHLYVSNLPINYTAQHLLKLFQVRYPSAFKAEIQKGERDEEEAGSSEDDEGGGWSSTEDEGDLDVRPPGTGEDSLVSEILQRSARRRRNLRRRPRSRYSMGGGASSILPRRGIVHFSSVTELRAAAVEMKDYRMISTLSRSTGFGQTQSVHYLNVSLENPSDSDDDADSAERRLGASGFILDEFDPFSRLANESLRGNGRGSGAASRKKNGKAKNMFMNKLSSPLLAYQLLQKLLSYHHLVVAKDKSGETALCSLVHNTRCLQSLKDLQKLLSGKEESENGAEHQSQLRGGKAASSAGASGVSLGMPSTSSGRPIRSFASLAELFKSQKEETRAALNIDRSVASPSISGLGAETGAESCSTTVMPYVSLADWLDNFVTKFQGTPLEQSLPKFLTELQQGQSTSASSPTPSGATGASVGTKVDKNETGVKTKADVNKSHDSASLSSLSSPQQLAATSTPLKSAETSQTGQTGQAGLSSSITESPVLSQDGAPPSVVAGESNESKKEKGEGETLPLAVEILEATSPFVKDIATVAKEMGESNSKVDASEMEASVEQTDAPKLKHSRGVSFECAMDVADSATKPASSSPLKSSSLSKEKGQRSEDKGQPTSGKAVQESEGGAQSDVDIGAQILQSLVSSWPAIVATVLGFYPPSCTAKSSTTTTCNSADLNENEGSSCQLDKKDHTGGSVSSENSENGGIKNCYEFSSVHSVDSFTTNFILNCDNSTIDVFVSTIVERMNAALHSSSVDSDGHVDLSLLSDDVDFTRPAEEVCVLSDHNVALLVGQRFMRSVVRLLGLEHSRVKNAFVEMQQMRQSTAGEGRSRGDHERSSVGRLIADGPSTYFEYDRSLGRRERQTTPPPRKNLTATIKHILSQFSWLAVHSLAEAAEASSAPVRIGVSKPLGASSVLPEYQGSGRSAYSSQVYSLPVANNSASSQWSLARQLHVRTPQSKRKGLGSRGTQLSCSPLPSDGIILRPCPKDSEGDQGSTAEGMGVGVSSSMLGGASIHDESFEDEFSDMEGSESITDGNTDIPSTSGVGVHSEQVNPAYVTDLSLPAEMAGDIFLDLDPSSSDDESITEFAHGSVLHRSASQGGTNEGDNIDNIYPFAWALDGRRIGENSDASARPTSPNGAIFINSEPTVPLTSIPSIRFGAGFLARTFARFVKDFVDIAKDIADKKTPQTCLDLPPEILRTLMNSTLVAMEKSWQWVASVLDVAEGQLRQGQYFETQRHVVSLRSGSSRHHSSNHPGQVARVSRSFVGSTPGEYIAYLLRTHTREDKDCLPVLDLYGYEHVVYMLDGLIYTVNNWPKALVTFSVNQSNSSEPSLVESTRPLRASEDFTLEPHHMEIDDNSKTLTRKESDYRFFQRTESVTIATTEDDPEIQRRNEQFFGKDGSATTLVIEQPELAGPPTPWKSQDSRFSQPLNEAYPLAQRPHLLKPFAKKEHLFGTKASMEEDVEMDRGDGRGRKPRLSVSYSNPIVDTPPGPITMTWTMDEIQQRWNSAISVFAHIFLAEGPGSERSNFLNAKAGFASRMARFRHLVQQLYDASQLTRDWAGTVSSTLSIRVRRDHLLQDSIDLLKQLARFHYSTSRVKFDGEDGSGPGVNRGYFASLANELKSSDLSKPPLNRLGQLFCEPGKTPEQSGLFAPCPFSKSGVSLSTRHHIMSQRRTAFHAIGRFLGLCLWFRYTVPFMVCRHVAKFFLGRELAWHDLAFYNADLYEGLRRMMLDAEEGKKDPDEFVATYCCYFEAPLCGQTSEPKLVELVPGGSKIPVTQQRVKEYVRLYSMFLMVECVKEELQAMKDGLNDVIPSDLLSGLTAEDFQLLLSGGSADINMSRLKSVIHFNHTHGNTTTICDRFEKMFWRVVSHMTNSQRQQLLYFATGSATLPASSDSGGRNPAVSITIDVISSSSIDSLPVASTCSQRMSIPLYPSYHLLKKKLLQAIQCQAYGLG